MSENKRALKSRYVKRFEKQAQMLVTKDDILKNEVVYFDDRENIVNRMDELALRQAQDIIRERQQTAKDITENIASRMDEYNKQYKGEYSDQDTDDERIFLQKTKEQVNAIHSYLLNLTSQLKPMVTVRPKVSSIVHANIEYKRAKVKEALLDYEYNDVLNFKDTVLPQYVRQFLKYDTAVFKLVYSERQDLPDMRIETVDRGMIYVDPYAKSAKTAAWLIEKYWVTRAEARARVANGSWYINDNNINILDDEYIQPSDEETRRLFGEVGNPPDVESDDLIEIWEYWQPAGSGLDDVFAVIMGGEDGRLVRYGRNPFPYKGIPYVMKSYEQPDSGVDGTGLVEQLRPYQTVLNTFLNMRIDDVRENMISQALVPETLMGQNALDDFKDRQKFIRMDENGISQAMAEGQKVSDLIVPIPGGTVTGELLGADLPYITQLSSDISNTSAAFRGQESRPGATLGEIQELLARNQGILKPVVTQVMRAIEDLSEMMMMFFDEEDFWTEERIVTTVSSDAYNDVIAGWHEVGDNLFAREVRYDEMDVAVSVSAVDGAETQLSKTFLAQQLAFIFQTMGQHPGLIQELQKEFDFSKIFDAILNSTGLDTESLRLTPEQKRIRAQQQQQLQQQQLQQQQQFRQMAKQDQIDLMTAQAKADILKQQSKSKTDTEAQIITDTNKAEQKIVVTDEQIKSNLEATIRKLMVEGRINIDAMNHEAFLERQNEAVSVNREGNNIN
jgi:hypothetical protein